MDLLTASQVSFALSPDSYNYSSLFPAISNEQLAVLAKSSNVSLRQSAEQMLLDRILESKYLN